MYTKDSLSTRLIFELVMVSICVGLSLNDLPQALTIGFYSLSSHKLVIAANLALSLLLSQENHLLVLLWFAIVRIRIMARVTSCHHIVYLIALTLNSYSIRNYLFSKATFAVGVAAQFCQIFRFCKDRNFSETLVGTFIILLIVLKANYTL